MLYSLSTIEPLSESSGGNLTALEGMDVVKLKEWE